MRENQLPGPVLILLFLLLPRNAADPVKPQYVVLVPAHLYSGIPEKACVLLSHLNESVTVSITLEAELQSWNLLNNQVAEEGSFLCHSITIPEIPTATAFITVQVKGQTQQFTKRKSMSIGKVETLVFVQTDKPIYKPGQTVRFRVVSVNTNFHPMDEMFPVVYIENPKMNRIYQWQNLTLQGGLSQLSFPLSVEPSLGIYKVILLKNSGRKIEHTFEVMEYVLPKFEVQVKAPETIGFLDEEFEVSVCGLYTYGKPVPGLVTINVCRQYLQYHSNCQNTRSRLICSKFSQQADNKGCFTKRINGKMFQLQLQGYDMSIQVEGKIKEEGTELEITGQKICKIKNTLSTLIFVKADSHFRRGLPFFGQVLLTDEKNQPIPNKTVFASVSEITRQYNFTTNEHGLATISIDTTNFTSSSIAVTVIYKRINQCFDNLWLQEFHTPAYHSARRVYSPSESYIHLEPVIGTLTCGQTQEVRIHYILSEQILKNQKELPYYFLIKARGRIAQSGIDLLPIEQGNMKGVFSLSFRVESDIAPTAQLLVYTILPNGEVVADVQKLEIEKCFANKVNLSFSSAQSMPASDTHLKVTATPLSLCALRAVDQSVLLMKPEAELSPQSVYNMLQTNDAPNILYGGVMNEDDEECIPAEDIIKNGNIYALRHFVGGDDDIYNIFQSAGLSIFTNSKVRKPRFCPMALPYSYAMGPVGYGQGTPIALPGVLGPYPVGRFAYPTDNIPTFQVKEIIRKHFPETWIWDLVVLDLSGGSDIAVKVPDTITEWKTSAFCLSSTTGLGLSPIISLQVFQPFFLELTLPYSVVQGEAFTLKATVLNYLSYCIRVSVQMENSSAFVAIPVEKNAESHCICENGRKTVSWVVTPKSLGKVNVTASAEALQSQELCDKEEPKIPSFGQKDTVVKTLLVEPEGIEKEETFNSVLCASGAGVPEKLSLKVPSNVVAGSTRATYTVLGDILGSAIQNLQNLVQMPYGCGEQNMILFVPNIYVLSYLNETRQLTEKIKSKAISHLISGYQRQLNYKHNDGSYSTFGNLDGLSPGNTWLTAFVLKSFAQAKSYIFVETSHMMSALSWLTQRQKENGCFQRSGSLLNNAIKGGVNDEVTLSAYITIALLEIPLPSDHPLVRNALFCLESAWRSISEAQESNVYTKALLAYAFALAGNQAKRTELLNSLDKEAVKEEDSIHWQHPKKFQEASVLYYQPRAPSVDVEMTSYILLAYLTALPGPSSADLSVASHIVKWITKQQNPYGGFSSTQDTVVALQALSKYGAKTFTRSEKAATVTVKSSGAFSKEFQVDEANNLLLQEVQLPEIPGDYSTMVSGTGCVYLQTSLRYNIMLQKEEKAPFGLKVDTVPNNCDGVAAHKRFQIHIDVSYTGKRTSSNMAIVDVKMVSGFIPVKPSVKQLKEMCQIPRTEVSTNHVLVYFKELTNQTLSFSFSVEQDILVENLKPATVKVYDYYETDEFTIEEYSAPCSSETQQGNV
ncbi:PREDICTED: alpha-2-macroglobulin-like [Chrysochloris asiatica]|uniref:Alpha-2-macroglobulin-like n=1 Tax=Chrysochloris asiatica TaxID=185453 RepID=A0A9B0U440_CHRAS|nr:PREDICTED: alpha-2-macroglobulin-like [Chrysochloris asiatica]